MGEFGLHRGDATRRGWYGGTFGDRPAWSDPWLALPPGKQEQPAPAAKKSGFWGTLFEIGKGLAEAGVALANSSLPFIPGPVADGGQVLAWDNRGALCCWDGLTGAPKWQGDAQNFNLIRMYETPAASDGIVLVFSLVPSRLRALSAATGAEVWSRPLAARGASPLIAGGVAYADDGMGALSAFRLTDGRPVWTVQLPPRPAEAGAGVSMAAAAHDGRAVYASWEHGLAAVEATTGRQLWTARHDGGSSSAVAAFGGLVYVVGTKGAADQRADATVGCITAFRADNGRRAWRRDLTDWAYSAVAVGSGLVIVGDNAGVLHGLDAANGQPHWTYMLGGPLRHAASLAGNTIFIGCRDAGLYALDIGTGRPLWRYDAAAAVTGAPVVANGLVYFTDAAGILYAVDAATGKGPDTSQYGG